MKYVTKRIVKDAVQWTGDNFKEVFEFTGDAPAIWNKEDRTLKIKTLEGTMEANVGDFIVKGVRGEFYPCKPDIFEQFYELLSSGDSQ